jgi:hypothetical protein
MALLHVSMVVVGCRDGLVTVVTRTENDVRCVIACTQVHKGVHTQQPE